MRLYICGLLILGSLSAQAATPPNQCRGMNLTPPFPKDQVEVETFKLLDQRAIVLEILPSDTPDQLRLYYCPFENTDQGKIDLKEKLEVIKKKHKEKKGK